MRKQREKVGGRNHLDVTGPGRLGTLGCGADQSLALRRGLQRRQQHARRRRDSPVQLQFSDDNIMRQRLGIGRSNRRQQAQRDRQIEVGAFLRQIGRRQVHGDPLRRERQADRCQRGMHALAALGDSLVGQADDRESRQTGGKLNLNFCGTRFEPKERNSGDSGRHPALPLSSNTIRRHPPSSARCC